LLRLSLAAFTAALISLTAGGVASAAPTHYVPVEGGKATIALNVKVPDHCKASNRCPATFEFSGYESGSDEGKTPMGHLADDTGAPLPLQTGTRDAHARHFEDEYVTVLGSVRGTGCSSGEFDLFSWRSALDGKEIIDDWIAAQPWSNGKVFLFGHSYSGLTAMMVASTQPDHLRAISASGLFGDVYRDITYPGGVTNYGFPLLWTGAVRPVYDVGGGTVGGLYPVEDSSDECAANQAGRSRAVTEDPLVHGTDDTDSEWYAKRSLVNMVGKIDVPVHVTTAYQDEQTGGRGPTNVFDALSRKVSRRLLMVNGQHGTQTDGPMMRERRAWADYWMRGRDRADLGFSSGSTALWKAFGPRFWPVETSRVILGYQGGDKAVGQIDSLGFPLKQTRWTNLYAAPGGAMTFDKKALTAGTAQWAHGSRRQAYSFQAGRNEGGELSSPTGPDEVLLAHEFDKPATIAGPITANLFVSSTAPETELFVQLIDRAPDGSLLYLNRGLLRGSHRAFDPKRSQSYDGHLYRPWRRHEERQVDVPGTVVEYLVDIWPVGHVFEPGHELVVKLHAPPADDNDYMYVLKSAPAVNTLHFGPATPSRLTLPVIPMSSVRDHKPAPSPCAYSSMRCIPGS
jgi:putative CocE/NonD family hydrolase